MKITRLTQPSFTAISPNEIDAWLRIDAGSDSLAISMLIASATEIVEGLANIVIAQADYQIVLDRPCDTIISLPISPVQTVQSVTSANGLETGWSYTSGILSTPTALASPLTVIVTAGYASAGAVPQSFRHAIAVLVAAGYDSRSQIDDQTMVTVNRLIASKREFFSC